MVSAPRDPAKHVTEIELDDSLEAVADAESAVDWRERAKEIWGSPAEHQNLAHLLTDYRIVARAYLELLAANASGLQKPDHTA
jgi:hypothetical protein